MITAPSRPIRQGQLWAATRAGSLRLFLKILNPRPTPMPAEEVRLIAAAGACEIDLARRELRVLGSVTPLGARAFEIMEALARAGGELVTKDALMERVWPGAIVMDGTLHVHAAAIRKALGPYRSLLKAESGRGYRLLGDWAAPGGAAPARRHKPPTNIPIANAGLIGRADDLRKLGDLLSAHRAVTLTGPGGIGKTSLALLAARSRQADFPGGSWLIELATLSDPALVASAVAAALGLTLPANDISANGVAKAIGDRNCLLLLDNCEHVISAAAFLADTILRHCPLVTILVTSREILRIEGEHLYRVPPLAVPAPGLAAEDILGHSAPELFVARARAHGATCPASPATLQTIAAICRHLDGIPLAIEFAAARAATLGVNPVFAGLESRFALLTQGRRTALPRHQTLYAACDWSYQLLPAGQQQALRWLAVFPNGFGLTAACELLADHQDQAAIIESLSSLAEKSLLNVDGAAGLITYRMLETTRGLRTPAPHCLWRASSCDAALCHHRARHRRGRAVQPSAEAGRTPECQSGLGLVLRPRRRRQRRARDHSVLHPDLAARLAHGRVSGPGRSGTGASAAGDRGPRLGCPTLHRPQHRHGPYHRPGGGHASRLGQSHGGGRSVGRSIRPHAGALGDVGLPLQQPRLHEGAADRAAVAPRDRPGAGPRSTCGGEPAAGPQPALHGRPAKSPAPSRARAAVGGCRLRRTDRLVPV